MEIMLAFSLFASNRRRFKNNQKLKCNLNKHIFELSSLTMPPKDKKKAKGPQIDPALLEVYRNLFDLFDPKESGLVKNEEIPWMIRLLGRMPSNQEIADICTKLDEEEIGALNFDQFCAVTLEPPQYLFGEEDLREAFRTFDNADLGYIMTGELAEHMATLAEPYDADELKEFVRLADFERTGQIDYEGFVTRSFGKNPVPKPKPKPKIVAPVEVKELTPEEQEAAAAAAMAAAMFGPPPPATAS